MKPNRDTCRTCKFFGWGRATVNPRHPDTYICKKRTKVLKSTEQLIYYSTSPSRKCEDYERKAAITINDLINKT